MLEDCDFENGLCPGWYQSYTDDFDWTRRSGPTWSYRTGPSSGHGGYGEFVVYINAICIFNLKGIFSLAKYCSDFTSRSWRQNITRKPICCFPEGDKTWFLAFDPSCWL